MTERERYAITGVGLVSALGFGAATNFDRLIAGQRAIDTVSLFDTQGLRSQLAAEVRGLNVPELVPAGERSLWSRTDALAYLALREALHQAAAPAGTPLGLCLGGTAGAMFETENALSALLPSSIDAAQGRRMLEFPLSTTLDRLRSALGPFSCSATVCGACASSAIAFVRAVGWLRARRVPCVAVGGADGLCRLTFSGFNALGVTDPEPCRPFDKQRAGLNLGEGAGFVILETEASAAARGAPVLAYLSGWALGAEAHHVTHPEPSGARAAALMEQALRVAGLSAFDVDYVNAHGTGTLQNDAMELAALRRVFRGSSRVRLSSSKAQLGHTLGAAGAIEAVISILTLQRGVVPPTAGLTSPEQPQLRHVLRADDSSPVHTVLSNSFGFGGISTALLFESAQAEPRERAPAEPARVVVSAVVGMSPRGLLVNEECVANLEVGGSCAEGPIAFDPLQALSAERSRRFGRDAAFVCAAAERVLSASRITSEDIGLVAGSAFGDVTRTLNFLTRILSSGARLAPPAEFPQLLASAAVGNASIYAGLGGPVFSVTQREHSSETAVEAAADLLRAGAAEAVVTGGVEAYDGVVSQVLPAPTGELRRSEGGGFMLLETCASVARRAGRPLAELRATLQIEPSDAATARALIRPPRAAERAWVIATGSGALPTELLRSLGWSRALLRSVLPHSGFHEASGALALVAGVAGIALGQIDEVLVVAENATRLHLFHWVEFVEASD